MHTSQRRTDAEQALEAELERLVVSGEYAAWFRSMAAFHRYSPTNAMWILAQRPDASRVASFRTWQQLGRHVRKGERGIMILHPRPYWVDPVTGERVRPPRDDIDRARLERRVAFGVGYVFDAAQTEGQPLPELGRPAPQQAPAELADQLERWCREQGVAVTDQPLPDGLYGYYLRDGDRIVLKDTSSPGERVATLAHELAHRQDPELIRAGASGDPRYYAHHRADCEAVAEGVAHAISARFGHDITGHSAGYIAGWIRGDVDRFRRLHERVGHVTRGLMPPDRLDLALNAAHEQAVAATRARQPSSIRRR